MKQLYQQVKDFLQQGTSLALATIVESRGSTPREVGAKMIIEEQGRILGTVGGGCGEAQVWQDALRVLKEGRPRFSCVDLTGEINENTATNCGGIMDVFIDSLRPEDSAGGGLASETIANLVLDVYEKRDRAVLATVMEVEGTESVGPGFKILITENGETPGWTADLPIVKSITQAALSVLEDGRSRRASVRQEGTAAKLDVFFELLTPPAEIVIVGAGHIARPLSQIAKIMGFEVTVIDDRSNFANRVRFSEADRIIVEDIEKAITEIAIGSSTHIVLVTRGHQMDQAALLKVIGSRAAYIGMIGSRRRVGAVFKYIKEQGITSDLIERVHAPIGIDIGAETPEEIAVAIMAEIVKVHRRGRAASLSEGRKRPG